MLSDLCSLGLNSNRPSGPSRAPSSNRRAVLLRNVAASRRLFFFIAASWQTVAMETIVQLQPAVVEEFSLFRGLAPVNGFKRQSVT